MMANNKTWEALVNPANFAPVSLIDNKLVSVKENAAKKPVSIKMKVISPKRYSFDDNGGSYEGL